MTCPVLESCYKRLQKFYYPSDEPPSTTAAFLSYDSSLEEWDALGESIHADKSPSSTHRLRAFYGVELVYYYLIPGSHSTSKVDLRGPLQVQRRRDHAGLSELTNTCALLLRDITMRRGHTELLGRQKNPAFELMTASLRSAGGRVERCMKMAELLTAALNDKRRSRELEQVGSLLGDLLADTKTQIGPSMNHLRSMLSVSLDNPVSPWNQSTQFQV